MNLIPLLKEIEKVSTDAELANRLKVNQSTISTWKARKTIPYKFICNYCLARNININDFLDKLKNKNT